MAEEVLIETRPAMFRNHPIWFVLSCILVVVGVGLVILLVWWLSTLSTRITVTDKRTILRRGLLSKNTNEVLHEHVRNIQVRQSMLQRMFDVGYVGISSAGQSGIEIEARGIPDPEFVKATIDEYRLT